MRHHGDPWPILCPMGKRYLADILETMGEYVDILKFSGGSFALMPKRAVRELIDCATTQGPRVHRRVRRTGPHPGPRGGEPVFRGVPGARIRHRRGLQRIPLDSPARPRAPGGACRGPRDEGEAGRGSSSAPAARVPRRSSRRKEPRTLPARSAPRRHFLERARP